MIPTADPSKQAEGGYHREPVHSEHCTLLKDDIHVECWQMVRSAGIWYVAFESLVSVLNESCWSQDNMQKVPDDRRKKQAFEGSKAYKHQ